MIATAKPCSLDDSAAAWHEPFLKMLPAIERHARIAFIHLDLEARADMVEEVVANAYVAYHRLVALDKADLAYATPLAQYAVRQVKAGRRVGGKLNIHDVTSPHCRMNKDVRIESLDQCSRDTEEWKEIVVEDRHAGPAAIAATKIDFAAWLNLLRPRERRIANGLATGETTADVAKRFEVSHGRISQIRRELKRSWGAFQGEPGVEPAIA